MPPRKANPALLKPMKVAPQLEAVIGPGPLPRGQVMKKLWEYIKGEKGSLRPGMPSLQNPSNLRNIIADDKLMVVFGGKKEVTMFEMTKLVSAFLS